MMLFSLSLLAAVMHDATAAAAADMIMIMIA